MFSAVHHATGGRAMKTVLSTMGVWALTAAAGLGQVRAVQRGSAAEAQLRAEHRQAMGDTAEQRAAEEKARETGRTLFGVDERLAGESKGELAGTLARKAPTDYGIGDWGYTGIIFQVLDKVSDTECLVLPKYKGAEVMLIRGFDTSKVTDGVEFVLQHPAFIQQTYTYPTLSGGRKTVLVLERNEVRVSEVLAKARAKRDAELAAAEAKRAAAETAQKKIEDAKRRTWTSASGGHQAEAKFVSMARDVVTLEKNDGQRIEVPLEQLSKKDQDFIRNREWLNPEEPVAEGDTSQPKSGNDSKPGVAHPVVFDFDSGPGPNFSVLNGGNLWTVDTDGPNVRITKPADDGTFQQLSWGGIMSQFTLHGDFTVTVDFALHDFPRASNVNGKTAGINDSILMAQSSGDLFQILILRSGDTNKIGVFAKGTLSGMKKSVIMSGRYRIQRSGSTVTGSFAAAGGSSFISLATVDGFGDPMQVGLVAQQAGSPSSGGRSTTALDISFDNLIVEADRIEGYVP